ncbi:MAG: protein kinase [Myxococcales bacterium]|nr:protein kinase [Myxococcales bacterium]
MSDDLQRGARLGKYQLLLRIGRGGMATVWVARQQAASPSDQRLVAVKAILPDLATDQEFSKMFVDEGRIIHMIRHPNVVDVFESSEQDGIGYIAMEWIEGDSLHAIIAEAGKRRPIPPEMAVRIIADAAGGLHAAHELKDAQGSPMNVVHRDVSPHNILIGVDGAVKLVDFGVAKAMGRLSEVTSAGQLKGKFGYMSPEQAMAKKVDRRSDVFALGIVLFELTTGRRLFRGQHDAETLHMVVSGKIPRPSSIDPSYPAALEEIVQKALQRDLGKRFQTAAEFQQALDGYLKAERVVVPRAGIANLLKKVLGERIEQRRKAIRTVLRQLDAPPGLAPPAPSEVPFSSSPEHASVTGISAVTSGTGSGISAISLVERPSAPSNPSNPRPTLEPPLPQDASSPSAVSQVMYPPETHTHPTVVVKRGGTLGLVIGIVGLAVALAAVLFLIYGPQRKTTVVNVQAPTGATPPAEPVPKSVAPTAEAKADEAAPPVPVDALSAAPPAPKPQLGGVGPRVAFPKPKPATPEPTAAPPRKNPYE